MFGGCDDLVPGVVSGLASNPTFLRFGNGNTVLLSETVAANFYLPLPTEKRRKDGIYALEHEGKFSAGMDFSSRPTVVHRLDTEIVVEARATKRS